jgi:hypothetical protein
MVPDSATVADDLEERLTSAAREVGSDLCVLFGSRAGSHPRPGADVDVALAFGKLPAPERRLQIIGRLQTAVGAAAADVVFLHAGTDPVLRFEIIRSGRVLHEARPGIMVEERVRALILYEDALPLRRIRMEKLRKVEAR